MARIAGRFGRVEPRATARAYLLGRMSGVERKNCWRLAEQTGHAWPGPMQCLLRYARWDAARRPIPGAARQRHSGGSGAQGPRHYDWAWVHIGSDSHRHLLT
jgi:hypothetical protein